MKNKISTKDFHKHVGRKLRYRRMAMGYTQEYVANELGLSYQSVQRYETGVNRINIETFYRLCQLLEMPYTYLFEDYEQETNIPEADQKKEQQTVQSIIKSVKGMTMLMDYSKLPDNGQNIVRRLVKYMAENQDMENKP